MKLGNVFVLAPQGAGKTRNSEILMELFGCTSVVDDWDGRSLIPDGALVLTSLMLGDLEALARG